MQAWQLGRRALGAAAAIGATLALAPAWAHADTVLVQQWIVEFRDDPGEASNVTVTAAPGEVRITQLGDAIVTADPACSGSGTLEVTCAGPGISLYDLKLDSDPDIAIASGSMGGRMHGGEGADRLTGSDENAVNSDDLAGGDGNDLLDVRDIDRAQHLTGDGANGGAGSDTLTAGNGDDTLAGDEFLGDSIPGSDVITSGGGDDFVTPGGGDGDQVDLGPGDDRGVDAGGDGSGDIYEGGPGFDEISFGNTTFGPPGTAFDAFTIDLAAGFGKRTNNGPEANSVVGFEDVLASVGDDDITGASGPNVLDAGEGNDVVNPLAGADHVLARAGDDRIDTRDGFQDRVQCHAGIDTVAADQFDELSSCENVSIDRERPAGADVIPPDCILEGVRGRYRAARFFRGVRARVECTEPTSLLARMTARIRRGGRTPVTARVGHIVLAEKEMSLGSGDRHVRLKPFRGLRRLLGDHFNARLELEARDEFGNRRAITRKIHVR